MAQQVPCCPDVQAHVQAVQKFLDAGYTHVALVQVGGDHQEDFIRWAEKELLPVLQSL
jgi:hypothetical protein